MTMTTVMATPSLTEQEAREQVRAYRKALKAGETPSAAVLAGVKAYRWYLRARKAQTGPVPQTSADLAEVAAEQVADQVDPIPRSEVVEVDARGLRDLLRPYKQVVARRPTLPVLGGVKLATAADQLFVVGTDLESTLESRMATQDRPAELHVVAPFLPLLQAATAATPRSRKQAATVTLRLDADGDTLEVSSGAMHRTLRLLDLQDFPAALRGLDSGASWKLDGGPLAAALQAGWLAASADDTRPILNGAQLDVAKGRLTVAATDSYRLAVRRVDARRQAKPADGAGVVQRDALKLAAALFKASPTVWVTMDDARALLADDTRSLYVRLVEGEFPTWPQLVPDQGDPDALRRHYGALTVDRDQFTAALAGMPATGNDPLRLHLTAGEVTVTAHQQDVGDTTVTVPAGWTGEELDVGFNPGFLADAFQALPDGQVTMWLRDGLKPALATADGTDGLYLLMPVRLPY